VCACFFIVAQCNKLGRLADGPVPLRNMGTTKQAYNSGRRSASACVISNPAAPTPPPPCIVTPSRFGGDGYIGTEFGTVSVASYDMPYPMDQLRDVYAAAQEERKVRGVGSEENKTKS
jgi:hypothetical protein